MVLSLDRWVGKVAVVTGASAGIGAAICDQLVENGIIVAGIARRVELIEERAKKLSGKKGKLYAVKADLTKEEDILTAFKWVGENLGPVHILINNAGVSKEGLLCEGKTEDWKQVFDVNVMALCVATREAVKVMREHKIDGQIIHINSVAGHTAINFPGINVYSGSKFAVTALTETLRQEFNALGLKIKITSVSPGLVVSEMTTLNTEYSEERKALLKSSPILQAEDIADGIIYVLSTPPHVQIHEITIKPVGEMF